MNIIVRNGWTVRKGFMGNKMFTIESFKEATEATAKLREYADKFDKSYQIVWPNETVPTVGDIPPLYNLCVEELKIDKRYEVKTMNDGAVIYHYFTPYCWVKWNE